ncbi:MAG TPA: hypothetical protein VE130_12915 [Nitrososphaeraceae archaeon]|nr:hypothetical protein [Nitrososphaeraceae archaeon]
MILATSVACVSMAAFSLLVYPPSNVVQTIFAQITPASLEQGSSDNPTSTLYNSNSTNDEVIPLPLNSTNNSSSIVQLATLPSSTISSNSQPITPAVGPSHNDDDDGEEEHGDNNNEERDNGDDTNDDNEIFISKDDEDDDDDDDNGDNEAITITSSNSYEIDDDDWESDYYDNNDKDYGISLGSGGGGAFASAGR